MIGIVDYGLGNISAIYNIYKRLNIPAGLVANSHQINAAQKLILPGVGAFDWALSRLNQSGIRDVLEDNVLTKRKPILGICVGMQMMAHSSEEGILEGLGWLEGVVKSFKDRCKNERLRLPHMGWNDLQPTTDSLLYKKLEIGARFYFLHSYYFSAHSDDIVTAVTDYGGLFASGVGKVNIYGVQFHPEKSHGWGIQLLKNFAEV